MQSNIKIDELINILTTEYGVFECEPRYDPASELVYTILSQHTSDINSERAFLNLMDKFGKIEQVAIAEVSEIEESIRTGGLSKTKAPRIKAVLNQIYDELGSYDLSFLKEMPLQEAKSWLKRLDGIGPKTAAIILCFSLGMPAMPVDTHIYRVAKRLGLIDSPTTADDAHDILENKVMANDVFQFHLLLINHGRKICKARKPLCHLCKLSHQCPSKVEFAN